MEGKVKGSSNAGFQPQHHWHFGWNNSLLTYSLQDVEQIPGLYLLDAVNILHRDVTTKKVSQSHWLSPGGEERIPSLWCSHYQCVTQGNAIPFYQTTLLAYQENGPKGVGDWWQDNTVLLGDGTVHCFSYCDISKVLEKRVNRSLYGSLLIAMLTWVDGSVKRAYPLETADATGRGLPSSVIHSYFFEK